MTRRATGTQSRSYTDEQAGDNQGWKAGFKFQGQAAACKSIQCCSRDQAEDKRDAPKTLAADVGCQKLAQDSGNAGDTAVQCKQEDGCKTDQRAAD